MLEFYKYRKLEFIIKTEDEGIKVFVLLMDDEFNYDFYYYAAFFELGTDIEAIKRNIRTDTETYRKMANYSLFEIIYDFDRLSNLAGKHVI